MIDSLRRSLSLERVVERGRRQADPMTNLSDYQKFYICSLWGQAALALLLGSYFHTPQIHTAAALERDK
jgi:hypothetical protein